MSIHFGGSWFLTMAQAASAWAATALPDTSVIPATEDAITAATELENFCTTEAQKAGLDVAPEDTDESEWRQACRDALEKRILEGWASDIGQTLAVS